jgi:hypothetical protein
MSILRLASLRLWQNGRVILKRTRLPPNKSNVSQLSRYIFYKLLSTLYWSFSRCVPSQFSGALLQSARGVSTLLPSKPLNTSFQHSYSESLLFPFLDILFSYLQLERRQRPNFNCLLRMAPLPAWRSIPPVIIYPSTRPKPPSFKAWAPHILKALLVVGLVLIWVITVRPAWFSERAGEFAIEKTVDLGLVGIIQK